MPATLCEPELNIFPNQYFVSQTFLITSLVISMILQRTAGVFLLETINTYKESL